MKKLLIGGAVAALVVGMGAAAAQPAPPAPPGVAPGTAPVPTFPPAAQRMHMRIMSDRVMTRDEAVKHVRDLFAKLDTNKDGVVTREEVDALHQKMMGAMGVTGDMPKRLADRGILVGDRGAIFDRLDTNHDGSISRQEFIAGQPQIREQRMIIMRNGPEGAAAMPGEAPMERMRMHMRGAGMGRGFGGHLFDMADANHDGRLTLQEAEAAALAHFDKADLNHDGKITPEERQQAHQLMHGERRPS
ncbi:MAG: EF-hand domain-containing protein [Sphingomicrobium sp.]